MDIRDFDFDRERLLSSGCVQVYYNARILEHRLHRQLGFLIFGSAFQIMNMHRDLSTYMVIRPILIQSYQLHMRATKEHTGIIKKHFV